MTLFIIHKPTDPLVAFEF